MLQSGQLVYAKSQTEKASVSASECQAKQKQGPGDQVADGQKFGHTPLGRTARPPLVTTLGRVAGTPRVSPLGRAVGTLQVSPLGRTAGMPQVSLLERMAGMPQATQVGLSPGTSGDIRTTQRASGADRTTQRACGADWPRDWNFSPCNDQARPCRSNNFFIYFSAE